MSSALNQSSSSSPTQHTQQSQQQQPPHQPLVNSETTTPHTAVTATAISATETLSTSLELDATLPIICDNSTVIGNSEQLSIAANDENIDVSSIQNHGHVVDSEFLKSQDSAQSTGSLKKVSRTILLAPQTINLILGIVQFFWLQYLVDYEGDSEEEDDDESAQVAKKARLA